MEPFTLQCHCPHGNSSPMISDAPQNLDVSQQIRRQASRFWESTTIMGAESLGCGTAVRGRG